MNALRQAFALLCVLWAGSLWSLAWVSSILFRESDRHLAGVLVGRLLSVETYLGVALAVVALWLPGRRKFTWGYAAAALLAATEWLLKPVMARAREQGTMFGLGFGAWHGVAALLYVLACLAVVALLWKDARVPA
jgi:Domain of unknown function (DUF4149)